MNRWIYANRATNITMARQNKLTALADELEQAMDRREEIEASLLPVKEYEEQIRAKLIKELFKVGFDYVKTTSGMGFGIVSGRKTYLIKKGREGEALEWAKENYPSILAISKPDLNKVLKPMLNLPEFFEEKVGEPHLSVRGAEEL